MRTPAPVPAFCSDVRRTPSPWLFQGLIIGALLALLCPAISLALSVSPVWLPGANAAWSIAHLSARTVDSGVISGILATQAAFIFAAPLVWRWVGPRTPMPGWLNDRIADARAIGAFQARDLDAEGLAVLIYVDLPLRRARIVTGVGATRLINPARLQRAGDLLTAGIQAGEIEAAVQQAIAQMARTR